MIFFILQRVSDFVYDLKLGRKSEQVREKQFLLLNSIIYYSADNLICNYIFFLQKKNVINKNKSALICCAALIKLHGRTNKKKI